MCLPRILVFTLVTDTKLFYRLKNRCCQVFTFEKLTEHNLCDGAGISVLFLLKKGMTYLLICHLPFVNPSESAFADKTVSIEAPRCHLQICHRIYSCSDRREVCRLRRDGVVQAIIFVQGHVQVNFRGWFQVHRDGPLQSFLPSC